MKKTIITCIIFIMTILALNTTAYAEVGNSGFFGGITEGIRLPKTTELLLAETATRRTNTNQTRISTYKEVIFIAGEPVEFEGQMTVTIRGEVSETEDVGSYTIRYSITPTNATAENISLERDVTYTVEWRRDRLLKQIIKDLNITQWNEEIVVNEQVFELDPELSFSYISVIEDITAGVTYYKGQQTSKAVYLTEYDDIVSMTTLEAYGQFYGYSCVWSNTETHRINATIINDDWQMQYQVRPSVSVNKSITYHINEPSIISFAGNYQEVMQNESGLSYNIYTLPNRFFGTPQYGSTNIQVPNVFEQLTAKDTNYLAGHFAEEDINRLYAMDILTNDPKFFNPDEQITRSQFFVMLVKALKLPLEPIPQPSSRRNTLDVMVFPDVDKTREDYQYIMAAYKAGIASGRGSSRFHPDEYITLEEAIYVIVNSMGLLNISPDPAYMTKFTDDDQISEWAKRAMYAAARIQLIHSDANDYLHPKADITKAVGAALINRCIEYMRYYLKIDYTENIVQFVY